MKSYPYPLPASGLYEFCHPREWHLFCQPKFFGGEVLAGNGYVAVRARKGGWQDSDFAPASADFLSRWGKLPWERWNHLADDWRALANQSGTIYRYAPIGLWLKEKLAPSPVWAVNEIKVRLSLLQLVAKLPRAEVYTGRTNADDPLWFRFSGGIGMIARDERLTLHSFELFGPARDHWTGERLAKQGRPFKGLAHGGEMANWPPAEPQDF